MPELGSANALLALGLILIPLFVSWHQGLKLNGTLMLSVGRVLLQLIVLAYGLAIAFGTSSPWVTFLVLGLFVAVTTQLLSRRMVVDLPGLGPWILGALLGGAGVVLAYGIVVVIQPDPWFSPQFWIPLGSALLAHGLSGGAIASEQFLRALQRNRQEIETHLSLGATPAQAVRSYRRGALRAALLPNLQTLAIAGLGNLPLFMSGQLVAGVDPLTAVIYELLLILMGLGTGAIGVMVLCEGIERLSFTPLAQLKEL